MKKIIAVIGLAVLSACSTQPKISEVSLSDRKLNIEEYFSGDLKAYGQFQDLFGNVSRRFVVDLTGEYENKKLTLTENFLYDDGYKEQRIWELTKINENEWSGKAEGVIGDAKGKEIGDQFYWNYKIDLPLPDNETMLVTFDDYMWLQKDGKLLNKAYMKKWGVTVGEVTIFFEKENK